MGAFDEECLPENMLDAQHASSSPVKSIPQLGGCLILFLSLLGSKQRRPLSNIKSDHFQTSVGYPSTVMHVSILPNHGETLSVTMS